MKKKKKKKIKHILYFLFLSLTSIALLFSPLFFFFNDTATTEIYTLSLHDALPISARARAATTSTSSRNAGSTCRTRMVPPRSEEHTSELQSRSDLVCRLLLEK